MLGVVALASCTNPPGDKTACRTIANCPESEPVCDANSLTCRACDAQRSSDEVACKNRNPSTTHCGPRGRCVACLRNSDCADPARPVCGPDNTCQGCVAADCQSKVCGQSGNCAAPSEVVYVDNHGMPCVPGEHLGTPTDPLCELQPAVDLAVSKSLQYIRLMATTRPYAGIRVPLAGPNGLWILGGSAIGGGSPARIAAAGVAAVTLAPASDSRVALTLRDLDLAAYGQSLDVVVCDKATGTQQPELTVIASTVHDADGNNIKSNGCKLMLDALTLYSAKLSGVSMVGTLYTISNLILHSNLLSAITLSNSSGSMRFLTVYSNGRKSSGTVGAVNSDSDSTSVEHSIVFANERDRPLGGTQFARCSLNNVVTDEIINGGVTKSAVDFVLPSSMDLSKLNLRLKRDSSINLDCCVDKVSTSGLDHDIDFNRRPLSTAAAATADIGAHEAQ